MSFIRLAPGSRRWLALTLALTLYLTGCNGALGAIQPSRGGTIRAADGGHTLTGDVRHLTTLTSRFLADPHDIWVYLPPGYDSQPTMRYPVLYMHDGNNLFDAAIAFGGHEWGMDETAESMIRAGTLTSLIIVGVGNTPNRIAEYTWRQGVVDGKPKGGEGAQYARFLVEEVKPLIDKTFRTQSDRDHTAVMGSSLGGLISLYLARNDGDVFGRIGVMSPSVWWDDHAVLSDLEGLRTDERIYLDMGTNEGSTPEDARQSLADAKDLDARLISFGYRNGQSLSFYVDPRASHNEIAWAHRAPMALSFLFGPPSNR